jgi:hypothetical protein
MLNHGRTCSGATFLRGRAVATRRLVVGTSHGLAQHRNCRLGEAASELARDGQLVRVVRRQKGRWTRKIGRDDW